MIVISGALVLVALVLLVLGLTMQDLDFVYGSIAVSLISFVFLVIGILQRRGETPAPATGGAGDGAPVTETAPVAAAAEAPAKTGGTGPVPVVEDTDVEEAAPVPTGATVLVVPGRPRYHVEGCRYLTGKQVEEVDVAQARTDYSPCGVCKPEAVLEARADGVVEEPVAESADEPTQVVDSGVPGAEDAGADLEPEPVAPRRGGRRPSGASASASAAATAAPRARKAPAKSAGTRRTSAAVAEPVVAPAAAPASPAKAPAARRGKVVVIPERGRFHTPDCRFVRDTLGTEELTRTQAAKQGYAACGVCKP